MKDKASAQPDIFCGVMLLIDNANRSESTAHGVHEHTRAGRNRGEKKTSSVQLLSS